MKTRLREPHGDVLARTQEQRLAALELANHIRIARSRLKRAIAAGGIDPIATLERPPDFCASMKVTQLLGAMPGHGPVRVRKIMARAAVADAKTLGGMTDRQRSVLVGVLEARR